MKKEEEMKIDTKEISLVAFRGELSQNMGKIKCVFRERQKE